MRLWAAVLVGIASFVFAPVALAAGRDRLPYSGIELGFGRVDIAHSTSSGDRLDFRASFELANPVFVSASRSQIDLEESPVPSLLYSSRNTLSRVDVGCHLGSDSRVNFVPSISVVEIRAEFSGALAFIPDEKETGWAARAAFRTLPLRWLEVGASIEWIFIPDDAIPTGAVEGFFYPFSHLGVGVGYESSEGNQAVTARVRLVQ